MHIEIKTDDPALIAMVLERQVNSKKAAHIHLEHSAEWHRLFVTDVTDEPSTS